MASFERSLSQFFGEIGEDAFVFLVELARKNRHWWQERLISRSVAAAIHRNQTVSVAGTLAARWKLKKFTARVLGGRRIFLLLSSC